MYKNKSCLLATLISVYFIKNMYLYQKITAIAIDAAVWFIFAYFKKYLYLQCNYNINEKKVIVLSIENEPYFFDT